MRKYSQFQGISTRSIVVWMLQKGYRGEMEKRFHPFHMFLHSFFSDLAVQYFIKQKVMFSRIVLFFVFLWRDMNFCQLCNVCVRLCFVQLLMYAPVSPRVAVVSSVWDYNTFFCYFQCWFSVWFFLFVCFHGKRQRGDLCTKDDSSCRVCTTHRTEDPSWCSGTRI